MTYVPKERHLTIDGHSIIIRPISPEDAELEDEFIDRLSPMTKYFRFLCGMNHIPEKLLKEFCEVDFDRTAAFIATTTQEGEEREIGVVRYAADTRPDVREMAITVADEWQKKGLGTLLAEQLIGFARELGIKKLYSIDLAGNSHMRALADHLGMSVHRDPNDAHQVIYSLAL
jgi:RimJ/RimL family protein N-acetyltransferase